MSNYYSPNRELAQSKRSMNEIQREQERGNDAIHKEINERIMTRQCLAKTRTPPQVPETADADVTIHVATYMKHNPGPGAYAITADDGTTLEVDYLTDTTCPHIELVAMNAALQCVEPLGGSAVIYITAANTVKYLHDGTATRWKANSGRKAGGDRVKHWDLWEELLALYENSDPAIVHIPHGATAAMMLCEGVAQRAFQARKRVGSSRR